MGTFTREKSLARDFTGDWNHRLVGLNESGVDFNGKSVLDAGCNMGIIAYEISKNSPRLIHGVDQLPDMIFVARSIFSAVKLSSQFECADLCDLEKLNEMLLTSYDVVLFLAVYQHLDRERAPDVLRMLASKCTETFLVRVPTKELADEISKIIRPLGFHGPDRFPSESRRAILKFTRDAGSKAFKRRHHSQQRISAHQMRSR